MSSRNRSAEVLEHRVPWISFGLVVLCVIGFAYGKSRSVEIDAVVDPQLTIAANHFRAHPYLAMPRLLEAQIEAGTAAQLRSEFYAEQERRGARAPLERIVLREQAALDRMTRQAERSLGERPAARFGVVATERNPLTFFSHVVFHEGFAHLVLGLFLLVALGRSLEAVWGPAVTLCAVTAAALGSVGLFLWQVPQQPDPLIGASGLVSGFLGAFAVRFAGSRRSVAYWPLLTLGLIGLFLPPWIGQDWSIGRAIGSAPPLLGGWNPSMWALAGGLVAGIVTAFSVRGLGLERMIESEEVATEMRRGGRDAEVERALQESDSGTPEQAFRRLGELLRREPDNAQAAHAYWDVCARLDRLDAAAPFLLRSVRAALLNDDRESALFGWLELARCELGGAAEPALLLRMVPLLRAADHSDAAVQALRMALSASQDAAGVSVASRVARAAVELDPETAATAAWQALSSLEIDIEERQALEALLAPLAGEVHLSALGEVSLETPIEAESVPSSTSHWDEETEPDGIEMLYLDRELELVTAVPLEFDDTGLLVAVGQSRKRVCYDRIDAVSVAAVEGLASKPVIIIDLILNWESTLEEPLKVLRLRTDAFDPRTLVIGESDPLAAVRELSAQLLRKTGGKPLPDETSTRGEPFAAFKSAAAYERDVLCIDNGDVDD